MRNLHKKPIVRKATATTLFIFGIVGLALPILPGWVFIGIGLYILSIDSPYLREKIHHYRTKHRVLDHALIHSYDKLHAKRSESKEV